MIVKEQADNQASITTDTFPKETVERAIEENKIILLDMKDKDEEKNFIEKVNRAIIDPRNELTLPQNEFIKRDVSTSLPRTVNRLEYEKGDFLDELDKYIDIEQWEKKNGVSLPKDERSKYFRFYTLYIKDLRKPDYDNVVADKLNKLKNKIENRRFKEFTVEKESDIEKVKRDNRGYLLKRVKKVKLEKYSQCLFQPNQFVMSREGYKVVMGIRFPSVIIISFLNGDAPNEFIKEFLGEIVEIPPPEPKADLEKEVALAQEIPQEKARDKYIFRKEDENYFIQYGNENFKLNIIDGLQYMESLLKNPYPKHFTSKQLYLEVNKGPRLTDKDENDTNEQAIGEGIVFVQQGDYFEEIVDKKTKAMIKDIEDKIEIAKSAGDKAQEDGLRFELVDLKQEYVKKYLRRGKSRRFPSTIYKNQYGVINNSISRALKKIEKLSESKGYKSMRTWKHLTNSIRFKHSFHFYKPENFPDWLFPTS